MTILLKIENGIKAVQKGSLFFGKIQYTIFSSFGFHP